MPQDYEFTDYEPVRPGKSSSKTRAPQLYEDWPTANPRKFGTEGNDSKDNEELETSRVNGAEQPAKVESRGDVQKKGILARGHGLTYVGLFLFTTVLFFRPYELFPALSGLTSLAFWIGVATIAIFIPMQLALEGSITARPREVTLVVLLTALALLSIPLAISAGDAWLTFGDTFIRAVLIFIVIINVVRTERRLYGLILLSLAVSCLLSVGAIGDFRAGNFAQQGRRILGVVGGMFGNPNDLALHLSTMVPLVIAFFLSYRNLFLKIFFALCAALFIAAIVATFSRGGFLALMGAALLLTWKLGRRQRFLTMTAVFLAFGAFIIFAPGGYLERILSIVGLAADPLGSAAARRNVLSHSVYTAFRHPLGIGMGNYHIVGAREAVSHNAYTQVAAELGLVALVIYVMFMLSPLKRLRQIERESLDVWETSKNKTARRFYYLAIGLQASLVAYMVGSFFASVAYQWYVYYLVGYAICLANLHLNWKARNPSLSKEVGMEIDAPSAAS
jgi:O-antigen ligase